MAADCGTTKPGQFIGFLTGVYAQGIAARIPQYKTI
jgi:hypothetical protein